MKIGKNALKWSGICGIERQTVWEMNNESVEVR